MASEILTGKFKDEDQILICLSRQGAFQISEKNGTSNNELEQILKGQIYTFLTVIHHTPYS